VVILLASDCSRAAIAFPASTILEAARLKWSCKEHSVIC
jgi:hypothetical protein